MRLWARRCSLRRAWVGDDGATLKALPGGKSLDDGRVSKVEATTAHHDAQSGRDRCRRRGEEVPVATVLVAQSALSMLERRRESETGQTLA